MLRTLLKFGFLLVIGILIYNFFFGSNSEKEQSRKIFGQTKELFRSTRDLVRSEREKFDAGKYDNAVAKVKNVFGKLRETANDNKDILSEIDELDKKRMAIEERLNKVKAMPNEIPAAYEEKTKSSSGKKTLAPTKSEPKPNAKKAAEERNLQSELDDLMERTNSLIDKMEKQ
jgi:myosin heavy subunit